jgi:hypothetical protein
MLQVEDPAAAYVSDGDLLSMFTGQVCMRNRELTKVFKAKFDMGLDAVDILSFGSVELQQPPIIAFSTELDHFRNLFTAGDLLFTNGGIIPNKALTFAFKMRPNMGLDGVTFIGSEKSIKRFIRLVALNAPSTTAAASWLNGKLQEELKRLQMDIWFSIEGSHPFITPTGAASLVLDGDVLSAATGTIVARQDQLLPAAPAGAYPTDPRGKGVDFGVDGLNAARNGDVKTIHFSTEILFKKEEIGFFDGDVLQSGGAVKFVNEALVTPFIPAYNYLGLDAIWFLIPTDPVGLPDAPDANMRGN